MFLFCVVKGHIRKGHALTGMKDLVKARQAFQAALDLDPNNAVSQELGGWVILGRRNCCSWLW